MNTHKLVTWIVNILYYPLLIAIIPLLALPLIMACTKLILTQVLDKLNKQAYRVHKLIERIEAYREDNEA